MIILKYIPIMINSNVKDELIDFGSANITTGELSLFDSRINK